MKRQHDSKGNSLRKRAEKLLSHQQEKPAIPSAETPQKLIHEFQVYQIELEMQNEELRRQQVESDEAKDRYLDLYDFAPIGYFTFDLEGRIIEVNLTGARLLGLPRNRLIGRSFSAFLERDFLAGFRMHLQEVFAGKVRRTCELITRQIPEKSALYVSLESIASGKDDGVRCRSAIIDITERKRMEEELREYERVIENSRDMMAVVDRNYKYVLANAEFLKKQGLERSQVVGKSVRDILGKDVFETCVKKNVDACFRGEAVQYEMKRIFPELGERDLLVRYVPVDNPGGINRIVSIIQDITERKRAEGVAKARFRILEMADTIPVEDMLQRALDEIESQTGSRIGFYHYLEADQKTLSLQTWSTNTLGSMCTAEGKGSHYPVSKAGVWVDCVHERRPVIHNDFASLTHRKGMPPGHAPVTRGMVVPILRGDQIVVIIGVGNKSTDYDTTDVEIASLLGDLSWEIVERRRAKQVTEQSEKRYRSYIEVTTQIGWITNADGEVLEDIPSWTKFTGQSEEEVKGWGWSKALHPDDLEQTVRVWKDAVTTRKHYETEYRMRRHDGVYRHFLTRGVPVFKDDGTIQEWVGTCIDITERKKVEEALQQQRSELLQLNETLEQRIQERTAELATTNETLRHLSTKLLSAQEDERRRIAGELHDTIGSCLAGIKFKTEDALQHIGNTSAAATDALNAIIPAVKEGIDETRRIQMDLRPPMLDDLGLLSTLSWFCRRFQTIYSQIKIEQEIGIEEKDIPLALKTVVFRVTQEAMNNIAKYSKADLAHLCLSRRDDRMELVIRDNGQGFDLREVGSPNRGQRGLGLTSMRERVNLSGGSFSIDSARGAGTAIQASWPLPRED